MNHADVVRSAPNGISVLIAGAGVGGLVSALECWRRGCEIRVFERTAASVTSGDHFAVGPSGATFFQHWPELSKKNSEVAYYPLLAFHRHTGERIAGPIPFEAAMIGDIDGKRPPTVYRHSRPRFHQMLLTQLSKLGVEVEYGNEVIDYYEDLEQKKGGVITKDGSKHEADVVIAADGVRGNSWPLIAGGPIPARSSGDAIFRVAYPAKYAVADPVVAERFKAKDERQSIMELWTGPGMFAAFWLNDDECNWFITRPDRGTAEESWNHKASSEEVLAYTATVPGWDKVADRVIRATPPGSIVDWKLMWRDPQPQWTSPGGYVVQVGDAAHTFLPSSGNGGTQAIEDAISLATCLSIAGKDKIPEATRVHNLLRFERVSCLQAFGVTNKDKMSNSKTDAKKRGKSPLHLARWIWDHEPEAYAVAKYDEAVAQLTSGSPMKHTNTPPGLVYKPWTIETLLAAQERGEPTILDGQWD